MVSNLLSVILKTGVWTQPPQDYRQQQTGSSQAGIYAIGDCCYYDGKIDLIATGLGEAPTAVNNAINYIDPEQKVQPKHSTSL